MAPQASTSFSAKNAVGSLGLVLIHSLASA